MAGSNVGNIEVTVDADTGKLQASIAKGSEAGAKKGKKLAEAVLDSIEGDVSVNIESGELKALEARIEAALEGIEVGLNLRYDAAEAQEIRARIEAMFREFDAQIGVETDATELAAAQAKIDALARVERKATVGARVLEGDLARVEQKLNSFIDEHRKVMVEPEADDAELAAVNAKVDAAIDEKKVVKIEAEANEPQIIKEAAKVNTLIEAVVTKAGSGGGAGKAGEKAGADFGGGFQRGMSMRMQAIIGGIALLAEPAMVGLEGLASSSIAVISSAFSAMAGGIGAATPIIAGGAGALAAVVVASAGIPDALGAVNDEFAASIAQGRAFNIEAKGIQKAMEDLAPAAQDFVTAFADVRPVLAGVQEDVQQAFFAGLGDQLRDMSTTVIPDVGESLETLAGVASRFFVGLGEAAADIDFSALAESLAPALDTMGEAIADVFRAIEPFLEAAAPAAQMLADSLAEGAANLLAMITAGEQSGELGTFLEEGVESLRAWGDLLVTTGKALGTLFDAGKESGDNFVTSLDGIIGRFDEWMQTTEGENALEDFFQRGEDVIKSLEPVLEGLKGFFDEMISDDAVGRFDDLAGALGEFLPIFGEILNEIGRTQTMTQLLDALSIVFGTLADVLGILPDDALEAIGALAAMYIQLKAVIGLASGIKTLVTSLGLMVATPWGAAIAGVGLAVAAFTTILGQNSAEARENEAAIDGIADSLVNLQGKELDTAILEQFLAAFEEMGPTAQQAFLDIGGSVKGVQKAVASGETGIQEYFASLIEGSGGASDQLAADLRSGETSVEDLINIMSLGQLENGFYGKTLQDAAGDGGDLWEMLQFLADAQSHYTGGTEQAIRTTAALGDEALTATESIGGLADASVRARDNVELIKPDSLGRLADASVRALDGVDNLPGSLRLAKDAMSDMTEESQKAADAADRLVEAWDLLFGAGKSLQEAQSDQQAAMQAVNEAIKGGTEAIDLRKQAQEAAASGDQERADALNAEADALIKENAALIKSGNALKLNTETGRENAETLRGRSDAIIEEISAMQRNGAALGKQKDRYADLRASIVSQVEAFGLSGKAAQDYVTNKLGLVPPSKLTEVGLLGLPVAEAKIKNLLAKYGATPQELVTKFLTGGIPEAEKKVLNFDKNVNDIPDVIEVLTSMPGITQAQEDALMLDEDIDGIPDVVDPTVNIHVNGKDTMDQAIAELQAQDGMWYQANFRIVTHGSAAGAVATQHGTQPRTYPVLAGEAGPELFRSGAIHGLVTGPTIMAPGTQVTSVALTEAKMRAGRDGETGTVIQKQVNNVLNVTTSTADPVAVATQVMNRAAAMAAAS